MFCFRLTELSERFIRENALLLSDTCRKLQKKQEKLKGIPSNDDIAASLISLRKMVKNELDAAQRKLNAKCAGSEITLPKETVNICKIRGVLCTVNGSVSNKYNSRAEPNSFQHLDCLRGSLNDVMFTTLRQ